MTSGQHNVDAATEYARQAGVPLWLSSLTVAKAIINATTTSPTTMMLMKMMMMMMMMIMTRTLTLILTQIHRSRVAVRWRAQLYGN